MTSEIGGGQPPSPKDVEHYKQDYQEGLQLFHKSFCEYVKPDVEFHKKEKLQDVMDKSLNVMNETAKVALSKAKQDKEMELNKDYQAFIENPSTENQQKVLEDINSLTH